MTSDSFFPPRLLILFSILFLSVSFAPPDSVLSGFVYDAEGLPAAEAEITNLNNLSIAVTKSDGSFIVKGRKGDMLRVTYKGMIQEFKAKKKKNLKFFLQEEKNTAKDENPYTELIRGQVNDDLGPLSDAEVRIAGSEVYTTTDESGFFGIEAKIGDVLMVTDLMGVTEEVRINAPDMHIRIGATIELSEIVTVSDAYDKITAVAPGIATEKSTMIRAYTVREDAYAVAHRSSRSVYTDQDIKPGQLTAGEVNDFSHFEYWQDLTERELENWKNHWQVNPVYRFSIILTNPDGFPIINRKVYLRDSAGKALWSARTDNTGRAELWYNPEELNQQRIPLGLKITDENKNVLAENPVEFKNGVNLFSFDENCGFSEKVDIAFMIDATGSMGDELRYLQAELYDVIDNTKRELQDSELRIGSVFYRDHGDEYLVKNFDFTPEIPEVISFIKEQSAAGGGDTPEAVVEALTETLNNLSWDEEARTKLLFILLDAPPHHTPENLKKLDELARQAAEMGVRIITLAASGTDKSTEFLMRSLALQTNGTYLFLTDDSGIGLPHIEPSTESYKVEMLNELLLRVILQFSEVRNCQNQEEFFENSGFEKRINPDSDLKWSYYPNPTRGPLNVKLDHKADAVFLFDATGKLVFHQENKSKKYQLNLSGLPTAVYYLKVVIGEKEVYGKVLKR